MLVRADGRVTSVPGATVTVVPGVEELAVARTQTGSSARTGVASNGEPYRIVAVPLQSSTEKYALVLGPSARATNQILRILAWAPGALRRAGVVVASAIGWVIARAAIRPVHRLTEAVTRVTNTNA